MTTFWTSFAAPRSLDEAERRSHPMFLRKVRKPLRRKGMTKSICRSVQSNIERKDLAEIGRRNEKIARTGRRKDHGELTTRETNIKGGGVKENPRCAGAIAHFSCPRHISYRTGRTPLVTAQIDRIQNATPIAAASPKAFIRSIPSTSSNTIISTAIPQSPESIPPMKGTTTSH